VLERIKGLLLRLMRVPPEPRTPSGSAGSAEVFRASRRYLQLKLLRWAGGQASTLFGVIAAIVFLRFIASGEIDLAVFDRIPHRAIIFRFLGWAEFIAIVGFVVQLPVSLFLVLLDWEMRWYIVTDRSLRIREGVWKVNEMTMTFANVQEVSIRQGPLERLFGIANLRVRTAGGGASSSPGSQHGDDEEKSGHIGYFRGVDNASAIRDLIMERLKRLRDAGLGDPDQQQVEPEVVTDGTPTGVLDAARELLAEARALRRTVEP
jgi:membrane protein YdbS with pleckstrin-like domain